MALKRPPKFSEHTLTPAQVKNFGDDTLDKLDASKITNPSAKRYVLSAQDRMKIESRRSQVKTKTGKGTSLGEEVGYTRKSR